jgi:hypothetical protein
MKKIIDKEIFKKAIKPLQNLVERNLNSYELLSIYYTLFDSPTDKDFKFIIGKYAEFYQYSPTKLEIRLIIDLFEHYGLTHRHLEKSFKIRIQKVLAKSRIFPTPAELIVLIKPDAVVNIYNDEDRQGALDSRTTKEIKQDENTRKFAKFFSIMND